LLPSTSATTLDEPPAFLVADEPPPTSFSALDVERFGGLQRPSTSAPPSSTSSHRRTPAPSSTEFQAKGKPLRSGPKRSEERRVGKEGRARGEEYDVKKKGSSVET